MNIYVGNLPYGIDDAALQELFAEFGEISSAQVIIDRDTGRPRGFGFVEMPEQSEAEAAIEALNGKEVDGRALNVNQARPKADRGGGGRGGGGGGGGGGRRW